MDSTPPAVDAILRTPEPLELILLYLSPRQLFTVQRTSKLIKASVACSPSLQARMLLRYADSNSESEGGAISAPAVKHARCNIQPTKGFMAPDDILSMSGLGLGGEAKEFRCLFIKVPCPFCLRSRGPKRQRWLGWTKRPSEIDQCRDQSWRGIKLSQSQHCTVAIVLAPNIVYKSCDHFRDVPRRLLEFPPGTGTSGDLDGILRNFMNLNEADRRKERLRCEGAEFATYVWKGKGQAPVESGMNAKVLEAVKADSYPPALSSYSMSWGGHPSEYMEHM